MAAMRRQVQPVGPLRPPTARAQHCQPLSPCNLGCLPCSQADKFHKTGRQLRSRMWWQNMKMKLIIVGILILIA